MVAVSNEVRVRHRGMKTKQTLVALITYSLLLDFYIYELKYRDILEYIQCKIFYNIITGFMIVFYVWNSKRDIENYYHYELNNICILTVIINYVLIIMTLTSKVFLDNPIKTFLSFNFVIAAISIAVLYWGYFYGYFKTKKHGST